MALAANGFSRKSTAPNFMASTTVGISDWPDITITGDANRIADSRCSTPRPDRPGKCRSRMTQTGRNLSSAGRKEGPSVKADGPKPSIRSSNVRASQTAISSSTIQTELLASQESCQSIIHLLVDTPMYYNLYVRNLIRDN